MDTKDIRIEAVACGGHHNHTPGEYRAARKLPRFGGAS